MAERSIFLDVVGESSVMKLLQYLIEGRHFDYTLTDLARNAGVSWGTLHTIFPKLLRYGIIKQVRQVGRAKLFKINEENVLAKKLIGLYDSIAQLNIKKIEEKQKVVLNA